MPEGILLFSSCLPCRGGVPIVDKPIDFRRNYWYDFDTELLLVK